MPKRQQGLFRQTAEDVTIETSTAKAPNRLEYLLKEGETKAGLIRAVGTHVAAAASIDDIRLQRKDKLNRNMVQTEWKIKMDEYHRKLAAANNLEQAQSVYDEMQATVSKYMSEERSSGIKNINNNRTKQWFKEEYVPNVKASLEMAKTGKDIDIAEADEKAQFETHRKYTLDNQISMSSIASGVTELKDSYNTYLPKGVAKETLSVDVPQMAYKAVVNDINDTFDNLEDPKDAIGQKERLETFRDEAAAKYNLTTDQKTDINRRLALAMRNTKLHAKARTSAMKQDAEDRFYKKATQIDLNPFDHDLYTKDMEQIVYAKDEMGEDLFSGQEQRFMQNITTKLKDPDAKETPKLVMDAVKTVLADPDLTAAEKRERLRKLETKGLSGLDAMNALKDIATEMDEEKATVYKELNDWAKNKMTLGGWDVEGKTVQSYLEAGDMLPRWMTPWSSPDDLKKRTIWDASEELEVEDRAQLKREFGNVMYNMKQWIGNQKEGVTIEQAKEVFHKDFVNLFTLNIEMETASAIRAMSARQMTDAEADRGRASRNSLTSQHTRNLQFIDEKVRSRGLQLQYERNAKEMARRREAKNAPWNNPDMQNKSPAPKEK